MQDAPLVVCKWSFSSTYKGYSPRVPIYKATYRGYTVTHWIPPIPGWTSRRGTCFHQQIPRPIHQSSMHNESSGQGCWVRTGPPPWWIHAWNITLQGINISHLGKRKLIFKNALEGDMLIPWRVTFWTQTWKRMEDNVPFQLGDV